MSSRWDELTSRLKNFLRGWLLILGLKECLVECATVCVKREVILFNVDNALSMHHNKVLIFEPKVISVFV